MAELVYAAIASLDGFLEDASGRFDWAMPDEEVHAFINDLERPIGTYLYGRRMYEVMAGWEAADPALERSPAMRDYGRIWRAADKVVYSTTLDAPVSRRTRIEPVFDLGEVRRMKAEADRDLSVSGPALAKHAFAAGLVDACHLFVAPVAVGGGKRALPEGLRQELSLVATRSFENGTVYLAYRTR